MIQASARSLILFAASASLAAADIWTTVEEDGRIQARLNGETVIAWQQAPISNPKGGEKLAGSNFIHPLATPSGFITTDLQPDDHMHHFGLWWPWKFIQLDGKTHNTWEIQQGGGRHVAGGVEIIQKGPGSIQWRLSSHIEVNDGGQAPRIVIRETTDLSLRLLNKQLMVLDMDIRQRAEDARIVIGKHHYSGFGWRGTPEWNGENSKLVTSEGHDRENGNGEPVRWVLITGERPGGKASVLLMSAAATTGEPERMRVWSAGAQSGRYFVNLNPVALDDIPLDDDHSAVSHRRYRVITSDREIDAGEAGMLWKSWLAK
jgi:hypothetical protein